MRIDEAINNLRTKVEGVSTGVAAAWDAFKGSTGMIPKEEQTIGNLKYAIRMNQEEMEPNEINFVDFNGMVLSMTIEEVMQLTEMPNPNEYYNLTFEHWTKTLEEIQDGRCHTVGATYHTTDGLNYYVVSVKAGDTVSMEFRNAGNVHWGDGISEKAVWSQSHTYERDGIYIIHNDTPLTTAGFRNMNDYFTEIYFGESVSEAITIRDGKNLKKICLPDNGFVNKVSKDYNFWSTSTKLKSIVVGGAGDLVNMHISYAYPILPSLKYLVVDNVAKLGLTGKKDLICFSAKNATEVASSRAGVIFPSLKYAVFDKVAVIGSNVFYYGGGTANNVSFNQLSVVDLPDTITSIGNYAFSMGCEHVYVRSQQVPTLQGIYAFAGYQFSPIYPTIHIRKDATYTDAAGTTYTGLEAYAHATNWATLYANTNYTFIDDL